LRQETVLLLFAAAIAAAVGQLLFRIGARDRVDALAFVNPFVIGGLFFYGLGTVAWIYALSKERITSVYAFTGLTFALVYLGGVFFLGEHIDLRKSMGVALVLIGLYLIGRN
jgi:drug/metabolite transporter (DMT)-like permease